VRSGLIFPRRLQLRQAVTDRYLSTDAKLFATVDRLIDHFEEKLNAVCDM
jgi:hypothetical protein